jgi:RNA recognition motif-containing protein
MKLDFYFRDPKESHKEKIELAAEANSIYVRNLAKDMTENMLREVFEMYGPIYYLLKNSEHLLSGNLKILPPLPMLVPVFGTNLKFFPQKYNFIERVVKLNKCKFPFFMPLS